MIAAQWEPAWRMCQVLGTVGGILLVIYGAVSLPLWVKDRWNNRVDPEYREMAARQAALDLLRAEGYR